MEQELAAGQTAVQIGKSPPRFFARAGLGMMKAGLRLVVPIGILLLWEIAAWMGWVDIRFLSSPSVVFQSMQRWIFGQVSATDPYSGTWLEHAANSSYRVFLGFLIASVLGVVVGILIGWYRLIEDLFDSLIQILRPIPVTAFVPFAIIFFGIRTPAAVFLIALGSFFPIAINTIAGVKRVPSLYIRAARMLGTPRYALLLRVALPAALPSIVTGLRLGIGLAWVLVIVSEMVAVKSGLGFTLWDAYYYLRMDIIVAAMFSVGLLGYLSDQLIHRVGARLLRWNEGG